MLIGGAAVALGLVFVLPSAAVADTAPPLTCGSPAMPPPCQQTLHFTNDNEFGSPLPPDAPASCPSFLLNDFVNIVGPGNGVEHLNINKAGDGWFTQTFTGNVTLTAYPPSSLSFDDQGNVTGIVGPPDASVPVFSGKITEWFGGQFNNKNSNNTGTFTVTATGGNQSLHVHAVMAARYAVGADPNGPPTRTFDNIVCS
jgi:hypothetical protein